MEKKKKRKGLFQYAQFSAIGVSNAAVDIGTLNLLLYFFPTDERVMLTTYNTVSYCLAVANSYIWNVLITFKDSAKGSNKQRMAFVLQGLVSLGVNNLVFIGGNTLFEALGVPGWLRYNLAKGVAMFLSFTASFFMIKYFVFKDAHPHKEK